MARLTEYYDDETIRDLVDDADNDSDAVSIVFLSPDAPDGSGYWRPSADGHIDGAVVVIKGDANVRAFDEWAMARGLVTNKPIRDDYVEAPQPSERN